MFAQIRARMHTSDVRAYPLYSASIFLSAFLLFLIQPMIARYLLPFFGGAISVWAASLVFFTTTLFLGYAYVYALSRASSKIQRRIHTALLAFAAAVTLGILVFTGAVYPSFEWALSATDAPAVQILLALTALIGVPYFLLSTTGPLLQHWYGRETGREPYHLYALSNLGSFLALAAYPFFIEPTIGLTMQQYLWLAFFLLCTVLLALITLRVPEAREETHSAPSEHIPFRTSATWVGLSALPAALLVATTARITQVLAPVPFLWVLPLALYLFSFILAFRGFGSGGTTPFALLIAILASYAYLDWSVATTGVQIVANLSFFFLSALYCHALLYARRPPAVQSSLFYLWTSFGGAAGTLIVTLIAPVVFVDVLEFSLGMVILACIAIATFPAMKYIRDEHARGAVIIKSVLLVGVLIITMQNIQKEENKALIETTRNFFGVTHVYDFDGVRGLQHGATVHGTQITKGGREHEATSYYSPTSGVGRAIVNAKSERGKQPLSVGVIGLGAGTLAAYCEKGDHFTFYEIDERIGRIANQHFTYLAGCEQVRSTYGDGRLSLKKELETGKKGNFDVLAVDAFSDDTIPVHLLTKEAVELYTAHLRSPESILAIHTSNRFFELSPVVMKIAVELGLSAMVIVDNPATEGASLSQWVLLTKDASVLQNSIFADAASQPPGLFAPLWTDDYANVFAALDTSSLRFWSNN